MILGQILTHIDKKNEAKSADHTFFTLIPLNIFFLILTWFRIKTSSLPLSIFQQEVHNLLEIA